MPESQDLSIHMPGRELIHKLATADSRQYSGTTHDQETDDVNFPLRCVASHKMDVRSSLGGEFMYRFIGQYIVLVVKHVSSECLVERVVVVVA